MIQDLRRGSRRRLIRRLGPEAADADISRDGRTLVYSKGGRIIVTTIGEGQGRTSRLTRGAQPRLSPDGSEVAYFCDSACGRAGLYRTHLRTHRTRFVTSFAAGEDFGAFDW